MLFWDLAWPGMLRSGEKLTNGQTHAGHSIFLASSSGSSPPFPFPPLAHGREYYFVSNIGCNLKACLFLKT